MKNGRAEFQFQSCSLHSLTGQRIQFFFINTETCSINLLFKKSLLLIYEYSYKFYRTQTFLLSCHKYSMRLGFTSIRECLGKRIPAVTLSFLSETDLLINKAIGPRLYCYLTCSWREKRWIRIRFSDSSFRAVIHYTATHI